MLTAAADNELLLRQEIRDQREHIQILEEEIQKLTERIITNQ
jgi:polyhydroxyalkanoate synthesis regulator phasin